MTEEYNEAQLISKDIQIKLLKGELDYDDEIVQFFIPLALHFTDFDWLNIIAENTLIDEDAKVVKNFLSQTKALKEVNMRLLEASTIEKLKKLFGE